MGRTPVGERRLAVILANYPNRDGRLGNGVGLDTPASVVELLRSLEGAGYGVADIPRDGDGLIEKLRRGPTNAALDGREISVTLTLRAYREFFDSLPAPVRQLVNDRWGAPRRGPFYLTASDEFALPAFHCGNVVIGLQPAVVHGHQIVSVERRHGWLRERYPDVRVVVYGHTHRRCIRSQRAPVDRQPGRGGAEPGLRSS